MEIDVGTGLGVVGVESIGNVILGRTYSPTPQMMDQNVIAYFNPAGFSFDFILLNNAFKTGLTANDFVFTYVPIGGVEVFSPVEIVPEPGALALLATSGMGVAALRRRRCLRRCCDP